MLLQRDNILTSLCNSATRAFKRDTAYFAPRHFYFGLLAALGFPLYYIVWHELFPQLYENLYLRLVGTVIFLPIVVARRWPPKIAGYFALYWYLALLFALPFFFTFMLFKNNGSTVWILSTLVGLFILILLLDWINLLIQISLGVMAAAAAYYATTPSPFALHGATLEFVPIFLFAIAMGIIVNYSAERLKEERRQAMLAAAGTIAHELRTPLLGIKSGASGLRQYLPNLMQAYRAAVANGLVEVQIRTAHLDSMTGVLERIEMEAERSNTVIDMLLMNVRGAAREQRAAFVSCSINRCVEIALQRYPFASERERALVNWRPSVNFSFHGSELLMVHIIFNLMKNALRHIAQAGKGEIWIEVNAGLSDNNLVFRDTGPGIHPDVLPYIFTRFSARSGSGKAVDTTGIGLAFCRDVAQSFDGSIICRSRLGEFTEFVLRFPGKTT
ncbi:MAG: HAMP domain-containing sensor histidine kinase [Burkholderiales bacterium]